MFNTNVKSLSAVHICTNLNENNLIENIELIDNINFITVAIKSTKCGK